MKLQGIITLATATGLMVLAGVPLAQQGGASRPSVQSIAQKISPAERGQLSEQDYKYFVKAVLGGMDEVRLGELAQQKGGSAAVRDFGQRMVQDHTQANAELKQLAAQKGATMPMQLSHHESSSMQHLESTSGAEFDKVYAKDMVKDHEKTLKEFEKAAQSVKDPDLRAWFEKTLPTIRQHSSMAQQMENSVKSEK